MTTEYDQLSEAISAISKFKLSPEDGEKFVSIVSTMFEIAKPLPVKKRGVVNNLNVSFGNHLRDLVKDSPKLPADLIEPLRERGVRLASSNEIAEKQIINGFKKNPSRYRQHAEGKWGLLSYAPPRLVG
jgi:hypothetical protein